MVSIISVRQEPESVKIGTYWNIENKPLQYPLSEGSRHLREEKEGCLIGGSRVRMTLW